ncbi:peroxiredoxin [Pseudoalteromonas sp. NBT06-2]|uniref:OsmC family protein n=1 Tax=Pseudoalteromonas sp. NBT06-2 TaxID=2025950 RepID=UPI000BA6B629|nr:OsmC family protein [Pseudoalteromonas sp. NBT06-2]PAJ75218.1 peroxiredoxin [Pseudoalteromonas sp. NBT06-2]
MSQYTAEILWQRDEQELFIDYKYSRSHQWNFDGGASIAASSSPSIVPLPYSIEENVDPEEAFIASLSSCHMLFFLQLAAKKGFIVDKYVDQAMGVMGKDNQGKMSMLKVTLRPHVQFSDDKHPTKTQLEKLHHQSHEQCFIANSVKTQIMTEIIF